MLPTIPLDCQGERGRGIGRKNKGHDLAVDRRALIYRGPSVQGPSNPAIFHPEHSKAVLAQTGAKPNQSMSSDGH